MSFSASFSIFFLSAFLSCQPMAVPTDTFKLGKFGPVHQKHFLPADLEEISGLEWMGDDQLLTVNDEDGVAYVYDLKQTKISQRISFKKKGDFEGIAYDGQNIYVMRSDAKLYYFPANGDGETEHKQLDLEIVEMESLCYHQGALWFSPKIGKKKNSISIYQTGLKKFNKNLDLALKLKKEEIVDWLEKHPIKEREHPLLKKLKDKNLKSVLRPSGIAINPIDQHIYLLCSQGKALIEVNMVGKIFNIFQLPTKVFRQPEGIAFAPNGDLFISNENKGGDANILHFRFQQ